MPEIPLSDGPRSRSILPAGVAAETLAAARPSEATLERAQELAADVRAGRRDEALLELVRHAASISERPPALELVLAAVLEDLLPEEAQLEQYAGRLFFCLKLQPEPRPVEVDAKRRAELHERARGTLAAALRDGRSQTVDEAVVRGLAQGVLEVVWDETVEALLARGSGWLEEAWLSPLDFDYVLQHAELALQTPTPRALRYAIEGYPRLVEDDLDKTRMLSVQMVKRNVLPRLLAVAWPELVAASERLMEDEPLFASKQDFHDVVSEARRLLEQVPASA